MNPAPTGWPRISAALYYEDPRRAIEWLARAFGFEVRILVEGDGGRVRHSELTYGDGVIMVSGVDGSKGGASPYRKSPAQLGGANTQSLMVYVDDVEAHFARARGAGAKLVCELETHDYGEEYWTDRGYECEDLGGHHWWFFQRLRSAGTRRA